MSKPPELKSAAPELKSAGQAAGPPAGTTLGQLRGFRRRARRAAPLQESRRVCATRSPGSCFGSGNGALRVLGPDAWAAHAPARPEVSSAMAHLCKLPGLGRQTGGGAVEQLSASSLDRASGVQPGGGHPLAPPTDAMAMGGGGGSGEYHSQAHHRSSAEAPLAGPLHPALTGSCQSPAGLTGSSSYTTLTPLQPPLPPISTVSPKFLHHPQSHTQAHHRLAGNFTLLSDNLYPSPYPKEVAGLGQTLSPLGGLHNTQQALSHYADAGVAMPAEKMLTPSGFEAQHPPLLARPGDQHFTPTTACLVQLDGIPRQPHTHLSARGNGQIQVSSRDPKPAAAAQGSAGNHSGQLEEINTKDVAQRITTELKRYSIPQAIFAQRVLGRSQGTLSDLLRNPKPWSKLKSGRETFRRMWKWLQEPEFQRMSALRLAGEGQLCGHRLRGRTDLPGTPF